MLAAAFVFISGVWITYTMAEFSKVEENIEWDLYLSGNGADCEIGEKARRFPDLYGFVRNATEIAPPANFTVTYFERTRVDGWANYFYPGISLEFCPPDVGLESVNGYEVSVTWKTSTVCLVYVLTSSAVQVPDKIATKLFPIYGLTSFWFTATSLPLHNSSQSTEPTQLVTSTEHYKDPTGKLPEPADWFARITYDVINSSESRSLQIVFSRPPPEYGFQRFQIALIPVEDYIRVKSIITERFYHEFKTVERGHYKISIKPIDDFFSQYGRCLCHDYGRCTNCLSSETAVFAID